jgi:hypothetical protein
MEKYVSLVRDSRHDHYHHPLVHCGSNAKAFWRILNRILHRIPKSPPISHSISAPTLASFFYSKVVDLQSRASLFTGTAPFQYDKHYTGHSFNFEPLTIKSIKKIVSSLPPKGNDSDPINPSLIESHIDVFASPATSFINLCLQTTSFLSSLKTSRVRPLIKKPTLDPTAPSNYRPVSNLPFLSKVFERVLQSSLQPFLHSSPNFPAFQSAYRPHFSTETALLSVLNEIYAIVDSGREAHIISLDLSAAFDLVDLEILLHRLSHMFGICPNAANILRSFLSERSFFVTLTRNPRLLYPFTAALLGPLLFTSYVAPVVDIIAQHGLSYHYYADDLLIIGGVSKHSIHSAIDVFSDCLYSLRDWLLQLYGGQH